MDNLRAVTEIFPGDTLVSQTDIEFTQTTNTLSSTPVVYLAYNHPEALPQHELRSRWMELDQHVRDEMAKELNFVRREVRPSVGQNIDHNFGGHINGLANRMDDLAAQGVGMSMFITQAGKTVAIANQAKVPVAVTAQLAMDSAPIGERTLEASLRQCRQTRHGISRVADRHDPSRWPVLPRTG